MEGYRKRMCSWCKKSASSTRLLGFMVPLMLVFGLVVLFCPSSSNWLFVSNYYPWTWSSVFSDGGAAVSGYRSSANYSRSFKGFVPPAEGGAGTSELQRRVVGGGERDEALSADYNPHGVAAPALDIDVREAEPPVENKKDDFIITTNVSNVAPPLNPTKVLPSTTRINRGFSNLQILEAKLQRVRAAIRGAQNGNRISDPDYVPTGPIYWNSSAFHRSYLEMEKQFKVFVYEEGEQPIFHNGPCASIYAIEGNFIYKLEISKFRTRNPEKAHVYFLPFSVAYIVHFIYDRNVRDYWLPMKQTVKEYVDIVAGKYPYWNQSLGSDHVMLSCHDWGPELSKSRPELFKNSIRALCNANTSEGFQPSKDVSIPEINMLGGRTNGFTGVPSPSKRPILVFFAGALHGLIRPILLEHWENKDPDVQVHKYLPKDVSYSEMMRKSRYCICPSGYEVASPRMVEALYTGCVPVLIKDHYVPPFSDVLNWKSFSVEIPVPEIPNLKKILSGISTRQYIRMQRRGVMVRRHFEVNSPPKRYDVFHMILHSIWLRRLNLRLHGVEDS
ncbi:Acetylglucosaminyltransferase EXT1/exostosin 1 [Handroanthus impetiginosus]|uniref:Acetylglucosaminyltransferase EXT1/exostosin 1 n=1 Tax=Handroanthus impetiginosus TaxID=429701 RepID=A0A2G9H0R7_9LAMI|nr:Acetylglucosaminyltransferase EXT1/exostosin 1 [Handroanthus impetiginosus]